MNSRQTEIQENLKKEEKVGKGGKIANGQVDIRIKELEKRINNAKTNEEINELERQIKIIQEDEKQVQDNK